MSVEISQGVMYFEHKKLTKKNIYKNPYLPKEKVLKQKATTDNSGD